MVNGPSRDIFPVAGHTLLIGKGLLKPHVGISVVLNLGGLEP